MPLESNVLVCGAGIAGIATAYHLAVRKGIENVILVDERPPLTLTSDKSTECYRNWWPGPDDSMIAFMNRSIDLMEELAEESGNIFRMNRRGYLFATADPDKAEKFREAAEEAERLGAGPLRIHDSIDSDYEYSAQQMDNFNAPVSGADLLLGKEVVHRHFPYISEKAIAAIHPRRAGWLSAQQMGMYMLEQAREHGVRFISGRVEAVETRGGRVVEVEVASKGEALHIGTPNFVDAAGPFVGHVAGLLGVELPVFAELHMKVILNDYLGVVPRDAPLLIWSDPQYLPWSKEEREFFAESEETRWLLEEFPGGVHTRPEGSTESNMILILWDYKNQVMDPVPDPPLDPLYAEIAIRGLSAILPGMSAYFERMPKPILDGGYYVKTRENRPLIGPMPVEGSYVIGALSGYGIMASNAAGELLATYIEGGQLPAYAKSFSLERYQDPEYRKVLKRLEEESWEL